MSVFSKNVEYLSAKNGISIRQIALKSGINPSTLTRIIKNDALPRTDTLSGIAATLNVDPWDLQTKYLETLGTEQDSPVGIIWNEEDVRIEASDLYDHEKLKALKGTSEKANWPGPHVVGSLLLTMPTDELAPVVPRGATLYLTVEPDQFNPDASNGEEAVGILVDEKGQEQYLFGRLTMSQGKMFITPTNPSMATTVEVKRVTARVAGWVVIRQK